MKINKFLERFNFFYDSVIRDVKISFRSDSSATNIVIIISTRDIETLENDGWVNVKLEINEVEGFDFRENSKESYQLLSNGLHILESDCLFYFDFGFHIDMPKSFKEMKKSKFCVVGKSFDWEVETYRESY